MCLAIPGKVEEISTDGLIRMGRVNFGGVVKNVCLDYVPDVEVGDYTIVHVGFALSAIAPPSACPDGSCTSEPASQQVTKSVVGS